MTTQTKEPSVRDKKRQRAFHSAKDYETSASQLGDVVAPESGTKRRASLVVAEQADKGGFTEEIPGLLMMLGIHPCQRDWTEEG